MPRYRSDGETQYEIDPMTGKVVGDGAKIPPRGGPRFRTTMPPAVLEAIRSYGNRQRPDLPEDTGPLGPRENYDFLNGGRHVGWPGSQREAAMANMELPKEGDPFARDVADVADVVDMGPTAPSIPMGDANAESPEPVAAPPERPVNMLREPDDGMAPVGPRAIPDASRTTTLKERMMIAQTRAAADKDRERAAGAAGLAVGMRGMPNQSSGFLDIDPTDPTRLLPEREQDVRNMTRADRAIGGADMRDQNTDSIWSAGGRKYPTLSMDELQRYVAEKKAKEGKQIGDLDVAGAKAKLKSRMERRGEAPGSDGGGATQSKLQQQYKEKRDARQARDAYGNAVKMTASSNPRRQRAGQALLDAIQSGPGGGEQDGTGMSANSIAREGMHAARAAARAGYPPAVQRAAYETAVKAATFKQEAMLQRQRDKSKQEFDAGENRLNRETELAKTDRLASATEGKSDAASRAMSDPGIRAFKIQEANPGMSRKDAYEQAKKEIQEERSVPGGVSSDDSMFGESDPHSPTNMEKARGKVKEKFNEEEGKAQARKSLAEILAEAPAQGDSEPSFGGILDRGRKKKRPSFSDPFAKP